MTTNTIQELRSIALELSVPTSSSSTYRGLPPNIVKSIRARRESMKEAEQQRIDRSPIPSGALTGPPGHNPDRG